MKEHKQTVAGLFWQMCLSPDNGNFNKYALEQTEK